MGQASLPSARAAADYRSRGLRIDLELELANKVRLKDAFIQYRIYDEATRVIARAGQFKMPFSGIQLESIWSLPLADRGLIDNVLVSRLQVAGRSLGAALAVELPGAWRPELHAGVFQGTDDAGNALAVGRQDRFGQDAVVRLSARPSRHVEVGASAEARVGQLIEVPVVVRRGYATELDVRLDLPTGPGRLRLWGEGMVGTSWLVAGTNPNHELTRFLLARGIGAWRIGGATHRAPYFEIYGQVAAIDPDRKFEADRLAETTVGLTYGAWDTWRLQAELEIWRADLNTPLGIAEFAVAPTDTTTVLVQLGARI